MNIAHVLFAGSSLFALIVLGIGIGYEVLQREPGEMARFIQVFYMAVSVAYLVGGCVVEVAA